MHTSSEDTFRRRAYEQEFLCISISVVHPGRGRHPDTPSYMANETVQGHIKACDRPVFRDTRAIRATMGFCNRKRYHDIPVHSLHTDPGWSKSLALTM